MEKKHIKYFQKQPELAAITFFKKLSWKTRALHLFSVTTTENIFSVKNLANAQENTCAGVSF